jgi:hypothetical protein
MVLVTEAHMWMILVAMDLRPGSNYVPTSYKDRPSVKD